MKACAICGGCYEDEDLYCDCAEHTRLRFMCPGTRLIAGNYFLNRLIGSGGMGAVFAATDLSNDHDVAIKVLLPSFLASPDIIRQFRKQGYVAQRLRHPNIAATYRCGVVLDDIPYTVMELLEGSNLSAHLLKHAPLPLKAALDIAAQIAAGLDAAHREDIVHRDLTPANIVLTHSEDGQCICKLVDFGLSTGEVGSDPAESTLGTPRYMAPEQYAKAHLDGRTDLFSLGIILYEMLAGKHPFPGPTPREVMRQHRSPPMPLGAFCRDLPLPLEALVSKALSFDPADRVRTAAAFECELREIQRNYALGKPLKYSRSVQLSLPPDFPQHETPKSGAEVTASLVSLDAAPMEPLLLTSQRSADRRAPLYASQAAALLLVTMPTWLSYDQSAQRQRPENTSHAAQTKTRVESPLAVPDNVTHAKGDEQEDEQAARRALTAALAEWIDATNARDFARQAQFYPATVEAFYLWRKVPRKAVLAEKRRLFAEADIIDIRAQQPTISVDSDGLTAQMRFNKRYVIEGSHAHRTGEVLQELRWVKSEGSWRIVSERDLRVIS